MIYPKISVVIATFNSEKTLGEALESIKRQRYPQNNIEILVVDGGSKDTTLEIAKRFRCKVYKNRNVLQVFGKQIGALKAKERYLIFLDSDEVLGDNRSFYKKIYTFSLSRKVKAVLPSGYATPSGVSKSNYFVNEFGDPFSYFMYHFSINNKFFLDQIKKIAKKVYEDKDRVIIDFSKTAILPALELSAIGVAIEKKWLFGSMPKISENPSFLSQSFYFLVNQGMLLGITKNDPVMHYSTSGWAQYLRKIRSRVINNIYKTEMGMSAFSGRGGYYPWWFNIKKYLFILYSFSVIFPLIDAISLFLSRRRPIFLAYPFLCLYTAILIIFYYSAKILGFKKNINAWGD